MTNIFMMLILVVKMNTTHNVTINTLDYEHKIQYNWKGDIIYEEIIYYDELED